jgi:hypothetical protein
VTFPNDPRPPETVPSTSAAPAAFWEDFVDIFIAPSQVFERRREGRYGLALLVLLVSMGVLLFASRPILDAIIDWQSQLIEPQLMKQNPRITAEMMSTMRERQKTFAPYVAPLIFGVVVLLIGLSTWLLGKVFAASLVFAQGVMIATYSQYPRLIGQAVLAVEGVLHDVSGGNQFTLTLSPARFMPPDSSLVVLALLSRFDVSVLWATALIAIGVRTVARTSIDKAIGTALSVWALATLYVVWSAYRLTIQVGG